MDNLCAYVYKKYSCDFVIPIDDDEIVVPENESIHLTELKNKFNTLNHDATYSKKHDEIIFSELRFAHFPIRSAEQIKSKALIGYTNLLSMPDKDKAARSHWKIIYEQIRDGSPLTIELLQSLSTLYLHPEADVEVEKNPINLPDEYLQLRYTHEDEVNALKNYCHNVEALAVRYANSQSV